ncbi:MAG TPA: hypothetical protein VM141_10705 [Planctomycetota bacterium]|nr:hypothetical protein [Planctomycetota bacterium]
MDDGGFTKAAHWRPADFRARERFVDARAKEPSKSMAEAGGRHLIISFKARARAVHVGFDDPPKRAAEARTEEEALDHYRRIRDEIRDFVRKQPMLLTDGKE